MSSSSSSYYYSYSYYYSSSPSFFFLRYTNICRNGGSCFVFHSCIFAVFMKLEIILSTIIIFVTMIFHMSGIVLAACIMNVCLLISLLQKPARYCPESYEHRWVAFFLPLFSLLSILPLPIIHRRCRSDMNISYFTTRLSVPVRTHVALTLTWAEPFAKGSHPPPLPL